jgi:hypothetical protein
MSNSEEVKRLAQKAAAANRRSRAMLEQLERLKTITGLSDEQVLDLLPAALDSEQRAIAALSKATRAPEAELS